MNGSGQQRVLGIVGSPRHGGNTDVLVEEILTGAAEAGVIGEKVFLADLSISPCRGCNACVIAGRCVQQDDLATLLEKMERSQVWVLGTPVYWWGPTAQMKTFVDRWYGGARQISPAGKRAILAVPLGDGNPRTARHTVGMLTDSLNYLNVEIVATILAPGVEEQGVVRNYPDVLAAARQAGKKAISFKKGALS